MYKHKITVVASLAITAAMSIASSAHAEGDEIYLAPYIGAYEVLRSPTRLMGGVEVRVGSVWDYIVPRVGFFINNKNARYVYAGFNIDVPVAERFFITPGFAVGAYAKGDGKSLGGTLEFRSSIELSYKLMNQNRVGIAFSHISNAGIYHKNPGIEDLILIYSIPIM